jgi:hypothetical protein
MSVVLAVGSIAWVLGGCSKPKPLTEAVPGGGQRPGVVKSGKSITAEDVEKAKEKADQWEKSKGGK